MVPAHPHKNVGAFLFTVISYIHKPHSGHAALSGDERVLVVSNLTNGIDQYRFPSLDYIDTIEHSVSNPCRIAQVAIDGMKVLVGCEACSAHIYDLTTGMMHAVMKQGMVILVIIVNGQLTAELVFQAKINSKS